MRYDTYDFHAWQACGKSKERKHAAQNTMKIWDRIDHMPVVPLVHLYEEFL